MLKLLEKNKIIPIIITILIAIEIFFFSSLSSPPQTSGKGINFSIIYHFIVFFLFAFFLTISIKKSDSKLIKKQIFIILSISIIYAVLDEIHQIFVPGRFPSIGDIIIDTLGIITAIIIFPKKSQ